MTPLEEIEEAIKRTKPMAATSTAQAGVLAALYTARAIERLEATVRMIGVQLQEKAPTAPGVRFRTWNDPHAYAPIQTDATHFDQRCRCGQQRVNVIHPAEI